MSSGQQSIDIPSAAPICMLAWDSPDEAAKGAADAPSGSTAKEAEITNARMVRTSRIALCLTFRFEADWYHSFDPGRIFDPAQSIVTIFDLPVGSANDVHQLGDFAALVCLVTAVDRVFHAVSHVIPEDLLFDTAKRRPDRGDLGHEIDAVAILVDHFRKPAHLAFDPVQAFFAGSLDVVSHGPYIPP